MKAFPSTEPIYSNNIVGVKQSTGMDLRDYFAAKAMNAYLSEDDAPIDFTMIANRAYQMADAMMKAREK